MSLQFINYILHSTIRSNNLVNIDNINLFKTILIDANLAIVKLRSLLAENVYPEALEIIAAASYIVEHREKIILEVY